MKLLNKIDNFFIIGLFYFFNTWNIFADWIALVPKKDPNWTACKWIAAAFSNWEFSFDMIWCYIVYLINIFSKVAVMIAFVFVLIWAFRYTITYLEWDDDWWNAKKTIKNALIWLVISTLAYVIVDIFIRFLL